MHKKNPLEPSAALAVVAALIREEGRFLICRRPAHKALGLLWEFPGGKIEPGETGAEALARECREELAVALEVGPLFMEVTHAYPERTIHLTLYNARILEGTPQKLEHEEIRWILPEEIAQYTFCPADQPFVEKILREYGQ